MILSSACIYGVQGAIYVATLKSENYISLKQIADQLHISFTFLTKVFQQMTDAGIMQSLRGPRGGIKLAKSPLEITLADIIEAIDGPDLFKECLLGLPGCGSAVPCPAHEQWTEMRDNLHELCLSTTLNELAVKGSELNLRLTEKYHIDLPVLKKKDKKM